MLQSNVYHIWQGEIYQISYFIRWSDQMYRILNVFCILYLKMSNAYCIWQSQMCIVFDNVKCVSYLTKWNVYCIWQSVLCIVFDKVECVLYLTMSNVYCIGQCGMCIVFDKFILYLTRWNNGNSVSLEFIVVCYGRNIQLRIVHHYSQYCKVFTGDHTHRLWEHCTQHIITKHNKYTKRQNTNLRFFYHWLSSLFSIHTLNL